MDGRGDKFECRLSQPITDFGSGEFVRRAGEQVTFRIKARERWLGAGSATLLAAAAPWQPGRGDINLGAVSVGNGDVPFNSSQLQGGRLLAGLLEGRSPLVRHRTLQGRCHRGAPVAGEVQQGLQRLPRLHDQAAAGQLRPDQERPGRLRRRRHGAGRDGAARLEIILDYLKADPSVNHLEIDGHSDNAGNRLTNRDLSRRRALAVYDYFKANGIPESHMVMRFHGERYPLVPNNNEANRAKNRRVTLSLSREAEAPPAEAPQPLPHRSSPRPTRPPRALLPDPARVDWTKESVAWSSLPVAPL